MQQATQPDSNVMLRGVSEAAVLPPLPPLLPFPPPRTDSDRRIEGTRLIPPPLPLVSPVTSPVPLRGALPPTADPLSSRELP